MKLLVPVLMIFSMTAIAGERTDFQTDPAFAGALIKYCVSAAKNTCKTIDRRKEPYELKDAVQKMSSLTEKLSQAQEGFRTLSVEFAPNHEQGVSMMKFSFDASKAKK